MKVIHHYKLGLASLLTALLVGCASAPTASLSASNAAKDGIIADAVKTSFANDARLKGSHIDVSSSHGVVTLRGQVGTLAQKKHADRVARDTAGVAAVNDHLSIGH